MAKNGSCSLCGQHIEKQGSPIDVAAKLNAIRTRRSELDTYIDQVRLQLQRSTSELASASAEEVVAQLELDSGVAAQLAPFVAEREQVIRQREQLRGRRRELDRDRSLHEGLARRRGEIAQVEGRIAALRQRRREIEATRPSREGVVTGLTARFTAFLRDVGFPKLFDPAPPQIDSRFVPHVRGLKYRDVGSTGALTLASLAWSLAIFQRAVDTGASHPGFLLIDSPQKGLTPAPGAPVDEYADPAIADRVWRTLARVATEIGSTGQLIVVGNAPPQYVADKVSCATAGGLISPLRFDRQRDWVRSARVFTPYRILACA